MILDQITFQEYLFNIISKFKLRWNLDGKLINKKISEKNKRFKKILKIDNENKNHS